ncbi:MAG: hypothetical protein IKL65_04900 [Bacilli bacterium]|nr:hypothetical protein [Bacilli bacterium]
MLLQKGRFTIKKISELEKLNEEKDGIKRIIDLEYMGKFEFEGNAVPISRMFIEYYKDEYAFIPVDIYNKNNEQMFFYFNKTLLEDKKESYLYEVAKRILERDFSLWEHINENSNITDFWWDLNGDYFIFFGDKKIELINYFIESCYKRDGEKVGIEKKLIKVGYKMK